MSDSEAEFESADEGNKSDDGWEIDCDFELPDVQQPSIEFKPTADPKHNVEMCEPVHVEPSGIDDAAQATLQSKLNKLAVNNIGRNSRSQISEESGNVVQNEMKSPTTPSNVSENYLPF